MKRGACQHAKRAAPFWGTALRSEELFWHSGGLFHALSGLPDLGAMLAKGTVAGTVALIILIVLGLALAVASTLWVRDADPDPDIRYPWIGTGLMPVMLMGVTIAATALVLGRVIG